MSKTYYSVEHQTTYQPAKKNFGVERRRFARDVFDLHFDSWEPSEEEINFDTLKEASAYANSQSWSVNIEKTDDGYMYSFSDWCIYEITEDDNGDPTDCEYLGDWCWPDSLEHIMNAMESANLMIKGE